MNEDAQELVEFLEHFEGVRLTPYRDTGGVLTIGIGHVLKKSEAWIKSLTQEQVYDLLAFDLRPVSEFIASLGLPLTRSQSLALHSFIFNVGTGAFRTSTMLRKLRAGDTESAAEEFGRWVYDDGKVISGLIRRRVAEKLLFLDQDWRQVLRQ